MISVYLSLVRLVVTEQQIGHSENFISLHRQEEGLRQQSIAAIEASPDLSLHAEALEAAMNVLDHFTRGYSTDDQDKLTFQLLGIRLFNTSGSALKLLLSGYY